MRARRYALGASAVAVVFGALLWVAVRPRGTTWIVWSGLGWGMLAVLSVAGGAWLAAEHGKPGSGFVKALGTGMLARLFAAVIGAIGAAQSGDGAAWAYLAGVIAGFVPLQVFEVVWFYRESRRLQTGQPDNRNGSDGRKRQ